jgi:hypothetical protein
MGIANASCQEQCQQSSYQQCRSDESSDCTTQCNTTGGAIFCDGDYVGASDVESCVTALNEVLTVHITAAANGTSSCSGNECTAPGAATVACAAAPGGIGGSGGGLPWALGAAFAAGIAGNRRRVRSSRA